MSEPIWSRHFAREIAATVGYPMPESAPGGQDTGLSEEGERLVAEMTEHLRHLPGAQVNWAFDLARALRGREVKDAGGELPHGWPLAPLRELRDYLMFLRGRHGGERPADEGDTWSEEDRGDVAAAALRRIDDEAPYPWEGGPQDAESR